MSVDVKSGLLLQHRSGGRHAAGAVPLEGLREGSLAPGLLEENGVVLAVGRPFPADDLDLHLFDLCGKALQRCEHWSSPNPFVGAQGLIPALPISNILAQKCINVN